MRLRPVIFSRFAKKNYATPGWNFIRRDFSRVLYQHLGFRRRPGKLAAVPGSEQFGRRRERQATN
jgi:hypothetical protein